jgi:hypothetical protein
MDEEQKCELIDHTFFSRALAGRGGSCPTIVGEFVGHVQGQLMCSNLMDPPPQPSKETSGEWNGLNERLQWFNSDKRILCPYLY